MRTWTYPAIVERRGEEEFVVTFPDIPEAITGGSSRTEALSNAEDALEEAILEYLARGSCAPSPRGAREGETDIVLAPVTASRAALANIMRDRKITNVALAARLGKSEGAIRRLTDGSANVKIDTVIDALKSLGGKVILSDEAA
jgi:antitoxin HicB